MEEVRAACQAQGGLAVGRRAAGPQAEKAQGLLVSCTC